jgi:C-methyltransferase C-terminal domain/Putative zinc binding domain/Methyltransferase domain
MIGAASAAGAYRQACRFCDGPLSIDFCDLGATPLANSYVERSEAGTPDPRHPLQARVCERCHLVQLAWIADAGAIFSDYAYFSSYSAGWLAHAAAFVQLARQRLQLGPQSLVVEVASNDGYLLKNCLSAGIPCLGVEPAANVAAVAVAAGVPTLVRFFGRALAQEIVAGRGCASLAIANNVLAHVPDLNDFVAGLALLVGPQGVVAIEAPHLVRLVESCQFDTIYHEHYAYWSLLAMERVLAAHGLQVFDVERLATHGGSLRVWACAAASAWYRPTAALQAVRDEEAALGVGTAAYYAGFGPRIATVLADARRFLAQARRDGRRVAAYGAAAKGNTFLNTLGASADDLLFVADRNPAKQGRLLPGSRVPIVAPDAVFEQRPDHLLILPWNLADEVAAEMVGISAWGGRFVVAIPQLRVFGGSA